MLFGCDLKALYNEHITLMLFLFSFFTIYNLKIYIYNGTLYIAMSEFNIKPTLFAAFHCHWGVVVFPTLLNKITIIHLLVLNFKRFSIIE